jgi:hypothetical protein
MGHVLCADTNTPARLAVVVLRPVPEAKAPESSTATAKKDLPAVIRAVEARRVQTSLDGTFSIPNVAPGTYFVIASLAGYISPMAALGISNDDLLEPTIELRKQLLGGLPMVTVDNNGAASINISLERAAAVSGTILYDDGSPASGIEVEVLERKDEKWVPVQNSVEVGMGSGNAVTSDRGNFRITGLPAMKEAIVEADLRIENRTLTFSKSSSGTSGGPGYSLSLFSGNVLRTKDAKPFRLTSGEERSEEDITVPLSKLHKIRGSLVAKTDGHTLNDGYVSLLFADDQSEVGRSAVERGTETFDFPFVPEGDYVLRVVFAADTVFAEIPNPPGSVPAYETRSKVVRSYGFVETPLRVDGDRTELTVDVPDMDARKRK